MSGVTWTNRGVLSAGIGIAAIATDGAGNTLAIDYNGLVYKSTDGGVTWAALSSIPVSDTSGSQLVFGNGVWIYGGASDPHDVSRSTDGGATWTPITTGGTGSSSYKAVATNGAGTWLVLSAAEGASSPFGYSRSTDNGLTYTQSDPFSGGAGRVTMRWNGAEFSFIGEDDNVFDTIGCTSPDGVTWTITDLGPEDNILAGATMVFAGGQYSVASTAPTLGIIQGATVPDLASGTNIAISELDNAAGLGALLAGPGYLFAFDLADDGNAASSTDGGATWNADVSTLVGDFITDCAVCYDATNQSFIAGGGNAGNIITFSVGAPPGATVPNIVGLNQSAAAIALANAGLINGTITTQFNAVVAQGVVLTQDPAAGTGVDAGSAVNYVVSLGPQPVPVPDLTGLTPAAARAALQAIGLQVQFITFGSSDAVLPGRVFAQSLPAGDVVPVGTGVGITLASIVTAFDFHQTLISQYANSPTLLQLIANMAGYIDPRKNFQDFFDFVWNLDTAQAWGLDIWGRIVGLPNGRLLKLGADTQTFGFDNADVPPDWAPWNQGTFSTGVDSSTTFTLGDEAFRTLILAKALANITATTSQALNQLLRNLFPGRGRCYVRDGGKSNTAVGGMTMSFVFEFQLTQVEYAILTQSGVMPHPAGVGFNVIVIPGGQFGFNEAGSPSEPFGQGTFYVAAA